MKVLLVNTDFGSISDSLIMPLTMYYLAGLLRESGHIVTVIDPLQYKKDGAYSEFVSIMDSLLKQQDIIAFTANTFSWGQTLEEIKRIRCAGFKQTIILGGVHASHAYLHIMSKYHMYIDYIIIGDGEDSLTNLIANIEQGKDTSQIPGIVSWDKNSSKIRFKPAETIVDLTKITHYPAYDLLPEKTYKIMSVEFSRGCYGNCTFCSIPHKQSWRGYSMEYISNNIEHVLKYIDSKTGNKSILATDDCFTTMPKRAISILELFKEYNMKNFFLHLEARVIDLLSNEKLIQELTQFPKVNIQFGAESGYDMGLKKIKKPLTLEQLYRICGLLSDYNLINNSFFSFIVGMPHESFADSMKTIHTVEDLKSKYLINASINMWFPVPSQLFRELSTKDPDINMSIFDENNWFKKRTLIYKTHPQYTRSEIATLTQKAKALSF